MKGNSIKCSYLQERSGGGEHTRSLLPLSGTGAAAGTVIPGGKQTPKVVSFAFSSSRCCCCCCCCFILGITRSRRPPLRSQVHPRQTKRNPSLSFRSGSFNGSVSAIGCREVADRPRRRERSVRGRCCVRSVRTSAMAEKEEDEEASVFYASFSFFSESHLIFVGQPGRRSQSIFSFLLFFPSSHPSQARRRPPQKSRS